MRQGKFFKLAVDSGDNTTKKVLRGTGKLLESAGTGAFGVGSGLALGQVAGMRFGSPAGKIDSLSNFASKNHQNLILGTAVGGGAAYFAGRALQRAGKVDKKG